jgi:hypothetical protein
MGSWVSSVGIAAGYMLDGRGSILGRGKRFFCATQRSDRLWCPPSLLTSGYGTLSPAVKRLEREAEHSPPSSDEVNNGGALPPTPIRFHGVVLINSAQEQFTCKEVAYGDFHYNCLLSAGKKRLRGML